ncbi:class I SAM-dependent methyltransferase [Bradyrhizobium sp. McL0616]|uniref:class I SAM-dependent methyltransferase n=1 Tax=Bradyrhizobium sp. McL0616 TaxID=3415674 RepID=UPI003CEC94BA
MSNSSHRAHWENVYETKDEREVSWFQESPAPSLDLIALTGATTSSAIVDIGGGASRLVDALLAMGHRDVTVLDLSAAALAAARERLGRDADRAKWIVADVTAWRPETRYDVWHDRATFHFLNAPEEQAAYIDRLRQGLKVGGYAIIGTFALDGPEKCSGLPVTRHGADTIGALLGSGFALKDTRQHQHKTPWASVQSFQFSTFLRAG